MMITIVWLTTLMFSANCWPVVILGLSICLYKSSFLMHHSLSFYQLSTPFLLDTLSLGMVMLTLFIVLMMVLASKTILFKPNHQTLFLMTSISLVLLLNMAFSTKEALSFYILFEASLIPTFILILGWGYQPERIQAGVYMLLYTLTASLPLLLLLLLWKYHEGSLVFLQMTLNSVKNSPPLIIFLWVFAASAAFLVKMPLYIVHLWLPKAHVEAPVAGSMILAGVLLKLGGYGIYRFSSKIMPPLATLNWMFITWAMVGGCAAGMLCLLQSDIKFLIALSSVAHMAFVVGGLLTFSPWGINGAQFIMLGHGLCSSGLFCIANMAYERSSSRSLLLMKGLQSSLPVMSLWWFILSIANMAAPPSLNLLGEMNAAISIFTWSPMMAAPMAWMTFTAAAYSLYLYSASQHGKTALLPLSFNPSSLRELLLLMLHCLPLNIIVLNPSIFQIII